MSERDDGDSDAHREDDKYSDGGGSRSASFVGFKGEPSRIQPPLFILSQREFCPVTRGILEPDLAPSPFSAFRTLPRLPPAASTHKETYNNLIGVWN